MSADQRTRTRTLSTLSVDDNCCPVCHETIEIFAIGMCNHPICFRCSTRLRILCEQNDCAICRTSLKHVVFMKKKEKFEKIDVHSFCLSKDVMIFSECEGVKQKYQDLLRHKCKLCSREQEFGSFTLLKNHMRDKHSLLSCQLCLEHLKLFSSERKFYTRQELVQHKKLGDANDKSYKGHPLCKFCDERYFDNDELNKHLRKVHFYCHICEENGLTGEYYCQYSDLHMHFKEKHFVCEEGECKDAQWSNVFRSQIDLNAHKLEQHSASMARFDRGQLRVINIDVNYHNPRQSAAAAAAADAAAANNVDGMRGQRHRNNKRQQDRMDLEAAQALSASLAQVEKQGSINVMNHELASVIMSARQPPVLTNQPSASNQATANQGLSIQQSEFPDLRGNVSNVGKQQNGGSSQTLNTSAPPPSTSASQAPEPSMANRLAMTRGLSVRSGQLFQNEFPSLNVKTTNKPALPKNSVWSKTAPSTNSSTNKTEARTSHHKAGANKSKMAPQSTVADDFPALQSNKKKTNQLQMLSETNNFKQSQSAGNLQSLAMQWIGTTNTDGRRGDGRDEEEEEEEEDEDAYSRLGAVGGRWINKKKDDSRNGEAVEFNKKENNMVKLTKKNVKSNNSSHHNVSTSNKFEAFEQLKPTPTLNNQKQQQQVKHQLSLQQEKEKTVTFNDKKNKKNKKNKNKVQNESKTPSNQPKENEAVSSLNTCANINNAALSDNNKKNDFKTSIVNNNSDVATEKNVDCDAEKDDDSTDMFEDADDDFSGNEMKKSIDSEKTIGVEVTIGGDERVGGGEESINRMRNGILKGIVADDFTHLQSHEHFPPLSFMSSSSKTMSTSSSSLSSPSFVFARASSSAPTQQHSLLSSSSSSSSSPSSIVNTTQKISSSVTSLSTQPLLSSFKQPVSTSSSQLLTQPSTTTQQFSLQTMSTLSASQQPAPSSSSAFRPPPGFQSIVKPPPGFATIPRQRTPPVLTSATSTTTTSSTPTSTAVFPSETTNPTTFSITRDVDRDFPRLPCNGPPGFNTRPSNAAATTTNVSYNNEKFQRLQQSLIKSCGCGLARSSQSDFFNFIASSVQLLNEGKITAAHFHQSCLDELTKFLSTPEASSSSTTKKSPSAYELLNSVLTELLQCTNNFELISQVHQVHLSRKPAGSNNVSNVGGDGEDEDDGGADHMKLLLLNKHSAHDLNSSSLLVNTGDDECDYVSGD